jgi:EmrB/QacA subfamily drug resistance transporter
MTKVSVWRVFMPVMLGVFLTAVDATIVTTALPSIAGGLGELDHFAWIVTAYLLTMTASMPIHGRLGDMHGAKQMFVASIAIFLTGTLLAGLSRSMTELLAFRALQGAGAGGLWVGAQMIIAQVVSPRERGRYESLLGSVFTAAYLIGPLVGGLVITVLSWRWVFFVNVPIALLAGVMATRLPLPRMRLPGSFDAAGAVLLTTGVGMLVILVSSGGDAFALGSVETLALGGMTACIVAGFVWREMRAQTPIIPLRLFRSNAFAVMSAMSFLFGMAVMAAFAFIPTHLQLVYGASPTGAGLHFLPFMLGMVGAKYCAGRLISRTGSYRWVPIVGTAVTVAGMSSMASLSADTSLTIASLYIAAFGIGTGLVTLVPVLCVQNDAAPSDLGAATSTVMFFYVLGQPLGTAILSAIFVSRLAERLHELPGAAAAKLGGGANFDPATLAALPPEVHARALDVFAHSLRGVYLWGIVIAIAAFAVSLWLREKPLRTTVNGPIEACAPDTSDEA